MVKKFLIILIIAFLLIFPPIIPKKFIQGENYKLKDYFGFVITYFNKDIEKVSIWNYKVKEYSLNGINLKNLDKGLSFIVSKKGDVIKEGEVIGFPVVYFKEDILKRDNYESLKNLFQSYISIYEILKELNLKIYLDSDRDEIYLENEKVKLFLGKENFQKRVENFKILIMKENLTGTFDATYDNIIIYKGK